VAVSTQACSSGPLPPNLALGTPSPAPVQSSPSGATPPPTGSPSPSPTFPINGAGIDLPSAAKDLLARTEFTRGRHDGNISIVFPSVAELRVPIINSGYLEFSFWPEHSWLTIVEPGQKSTTFYDVDVTTGEKRAIARLPAAPAVDEEFAVGRDPTGEVLVVADETVGVLGIDVGHGAVDVVVPTVVRGQDRGEVLWSPTGESVAAPRCDESTCTTEVIDTRTWTPVTVVGPFAPLALTDEYIIGTAGTDGRQLAVIDLATGEAKAVIPDLVEVWGAFATTDGGFTVTGGAERDDGLEQRVYQLDPGDGSSRPIYSGSTSNGRSFMYGDWSTPDWALLLGPENDQLILIDAHTLLVYDETLHTIDHPDG